MPIEARPIYAESMVWTLEIPRGIQSRAILEGRHKLIHTEKRGKRGTRKTEELYDLLADRDEIHDLGVETSGAGRRLADQLARWARVLEREATPPQPFEMDDSTRQRLRALGYL
jgi:hypothetical protein